MVGALGPHLELGGQVGRHLRAVTLTVDAAGRAGIEQAAQRFGAVLAAKGAAVLLVPDRSDADALHYHGLVLDPFEPGAVGNALVMAEWSKATGGKTHRPTGQAKDSDCRAVTGWRAFVDAGADWSAWAAKTHGKTFADSLTTWSGYCFKDQQSGGGVDLDGVIAAGDFADAFEAARSALATERLRVLQSIARPAAKAATA